MPPTIKPNGREIVNYYAALKQTVEGQGEENEGAVSIAFLNLLNEAAGKKKWTVVHQQKYRSNGRTLKPDGTLRDEWRLPHGYWEAKDSGDDLDAEIRSKIGKGYPTSNILFEDTQTGVLVQNGHEVYRADLNDAAELADLINHFLAYEAPSIEGFNAAVRQFSEEVPRLAEGLKERIEEAHGNNSRFQEAYAAFYELCQNSLNPNISRDAVNEMLIQHLLTERLFRTVFDNPEFTRRNVIAREIEKVIEALTSGYFNRAQFLGRLDRFYDAIENTAADLSDFSDKQTFLNTVYERFFQGYSVKLADTHGIVYTPQEIVDFMVSAVDEVLQSEFGLSLSAPGVNILDPCTGTGNFIVNILNRVPLSDIQRVYREQLFANEVMLLPYYIAGLNVEHAYYERTRRYEPFEGISFVDTLDLREGPQPELPGLFTEENARRVNRQRDKQITVIIGNPPYNVGQLNENDNNKNRKYAGPNGVDARVRDTYARESDATLKTQLYDPYVKFFRWATDRLREQEGIICFVSNNSFIDQVAFDGMRKNLLKDFTYVSHIDLHGNTRQNPALSGTAHNVFGIRVGVGITIAVRQNKNSNSGLFYHRVPEFWRKEQKLGWLDTVVSSQQSGLLNRVVWSKLIPDSRNSWLIPTFAGQFDSFMQIGARKTKTQSREAETIFQLFSSSLKTNRDSTVYDPHLSSLTRRMKETTEKYNAEVDRYVRLGSPATVDEFVNSDLLKWDGTLKGELKNLNYSSFSVAHIRNATYRPFSRVRIYFDPLFINSIYLQHYFFPTAHSEDENTAICLTDRGSEKPFMTLAVNRLSDLHIVGAGASAQCFPFYTYDEDGSNRRENITDWALGEYRAHYGDETITKWDIFYYVYGLLHHPGYREKYGDNLKRELPRLPFAPDFRAFSAAGKALADLHLNYETVEMYPLQHVEAQDATLDKLFHVQKMRLRGRKTEGAGETQRIVKEHDTLQVNDYLTLKGIPPEVFRYRLGNRSAVEWIVDQYQVKTDSRSGISHDPNDPANPGYIVDLFKRVVTVSTRTVEIVEGLPEDFGG